MVKSRILIQNEFDEEDYRDFYFNINAVNGVYVVNEEQMGVILTGNDYILKYNQSLFEEIQNTLKLKTIGFN
tara:strand:- start:270 stop:485 length:216 start_codon:yes stop_codon:yes gene_type:complete